MKEHPAGRGVSSLKKSKNKKKKSKKISLVPVASLEDVTKELIYQNADAGKVQEEWDSSLTQDQ